MLRRFGIASKLLLAFGVTFALAIVIAVAGWFGFESVSSSQRSVIGNAIPTLRQAQRLAEINAGIVASSGRLARSETDAERAAINDYLDWSSNALLDLVDQMEEGNPQARNFDRLRNVVRSIRNNLVDQNDQVRLKLELQQSAARVSGQVLEAADQLTELSESLVANAASGATATSVGLYDLMESPNNTEDAFVALDRLVEVDLDGMERMFELRLRSARVASFIAQLYRENRGAQIAELQQRLQRNLAVLDRRLNDVNDPGRKAQATRLLDDIVRQTAADEGQSLFTLRLQALETNDAIEALIAANNVLAEQLTSEVSKIVDSSGEAIDETTAQAEYALGSSRQRFLIVAVATGLVVLVFFWWFLRGQIIRRLASLRRSTLDLAGGELSSSPDVGGSDELADMGAALAVFRDNALARRKLESELLENQQMLEQRVTERTAQLEQANNDLADSVRQHAQARERAELANRAKTTFLATMSHELRTPVSGMLGTSRLLEQTGLQEDQIELTHALRSAGESLLSIVNDVLDLSKFEGGRLNLEYVTFEVTTLVLDLISLLRSPAEEKGLTLNYAIDPDIDDILVGDEERLRQVLTNLLGNAIKFTDRGSISLELEKIPARSTGECTILFRVKDSGIGIPQNLQESIFEPFTQVDASVARRRGGSGLGLAICRRIVDAMGGSMSVVSSPGQGTVFEFSIAFRIGASQIPEIPHGTGSTALPAPQTVLVVEDDSVNRMVTRRFLEASQHRVIEAVSGFDALRLFDTHGDIDLVLMDIGLPGMDGLETARHIRRRFEKGRDKIPIVAMSAHVFREEINDYLEAGMDGYLAKPFETAQLDKVIDSVLSHTNMPVESVPASRGGHEVLNTQVLETDIDAIGNRAVADIIDLFLSMRDETVSGIAASLDNDDRNDAIYLFHRLKSSSGNLGLEKLSLAAAELEKSLGSGELSAIALSEFYDVFDRSVDALRVFRRRLIDNPPSLQTDNPRRERSE